MWGQSGPSGCFATVSVLQVLWAPYTTLASDSLPVSVVSGGAALGSHPLWVPAILWPGRTAHVECGTWRFVRVKGRICVWREVLNQNLESGFSANLMLFLWLHNNIVLVAEKPSFN